MGRKTTEGRGGRGWLTGLLLGLAFAARAQDLKQIRVRDGLSHDRVFAAIRDGDGLMWFSTRSGMDRYDGVSVRHYPLYARIAVPGNAGRFNYATTDAAGIPWACNSNGDLFVYVPGADAFRLRLRLSDSARLRNPSVRGLRAFPDGRILLFGSFGLAGYDPAGNRLTFPLQPEAFDVYAAEPLVDSVCAVGTAAGLFFLRAFPGAEEMAVSPVEGSPAVRIQSLRCDPSKGRLYAGTFGGTVYRYDLTARLFAPMGTVPGSTPVRDMEVRGESLYVATDGSGILVLDRNTGRLLPDRTVSVSEASALTANSVYDLYDDGENRLWIATYGGGVCLLDGNLPPFGFLSTDAGSGGKNAGNSVSSLLEDSRGNLWCGTGSGIRILSVSDGHRRLLPETGTDPRLRARILALCEDSRGNVWAGGFACGAFCIDRRTFRVTGSLSAVAERHGTRADHIYTIVSDAAGNLWFGGLFGKVIRYHPVTGDYREYASHFVNALACREGAVLAGTTHGLYRLDPETDSLKPWPMPVPGGETLLRSHINFVFATERNIWFSTDRGLGCLDSETGKVRVYTRDEGLVSDVVYAVTADTLGRIWVSTDRGLSLLEPVSGRISNFDRGDGMRDDGFNTRAVCRTGDGRLLFGCSQGAVAFDPTTVREAKTAGRLFLSDLRLNYRSVYDSVGRNPFSVAVNRLSEITLPYRQNTFSWAFTALNYTDPFRIRYRWMLEGYDGRWLESPVPRTADYARIPHGKYRFRVEALDGENGRVLDSRSVSVTVLPPLWATAGAKTVYVLFVLLSGTFLYRWLHGRARRKRYAEKIRDFTVTAHEIKTPLTLILGPLNRLKERAGLPEEDSSLLDMAVRHSERLHLLVTRLLDFQRAEMRAVGLTVSRQDAAEYVAARTEIFRPLADRKGIALTFESRLTRTEVWFDRAKMETILGNLLSNALKYTPSGGSVRVKLLPAGRNGWTVEICDTGIGIPPQARRFLFRRFYRAENAIASGESGSGIGLMLCRTLVRLHAGKMTFDALPAGGTRFVVRFRYGDGWCRHRRGVSMARREDVPSLPVSPSEKEAGAVSEEPEEKNPKAVVLIAEDHAELRGFLRECLAGDYRVEEAADGNTAWERILEVSPDLILSDVMMPGTDGCFLCSRVKENLETSHIPVILVTVLDDQTDVMRGYGCGADNYIVKPFDAVLLKMTVDNCLKGRHALRRRLLKCVGAEPEVPLENELDDRFIREITQHLERHLTDGEYTLDDLSRDMALSRSSLYHKIKALTSLSPHDFVRIFRLNRAARMLRGGGCTVAEAAYATGFSDAKYFGTVFRKQYGVSPARAVRRVEIPSR